MTDNQNPTAVVVNDDVTQLRVLSGLLRKDGFETQMFETAQDALAAMDQERPPDLIVTDLYMPGIDGWRFCRLLRSSEYPLFNEVPILVVSATFAGDEASRITADLGANAFLPSPVDGRRFIASARSLLAGERPRDTLHVLIIEDSKTLAGMLKKSFEQEGYHAGIASDLGAAVDAFEREPYHIAVIDYHLPDGKGDALLPRFRKARPDIVCIMMTTDPNPELGLIWMQAGAAAYLRKPFKPDYLLELCARARRERALLQVEERLEERTRELRESRERLRVSEANYRRLLKNVPAVIYQSRMTPGGEFTFPFIAETVITMLGVSAEAVMADSSRILGMIHPEDQSLFHEGVLKSARTLQPYEERFRFIKDGKSRWLEARSTPESLEDGSILWDGFFFDITRIKGLEMEVQDRRENFQAFFNTMTDMIFVGRPDGSIVLANPAVSRILGYSADELTAMHILDVHRPGDRREAETILTQMFRGERESCPLPLCAKDGRAVPVETRIWFGKWNGEACLFGISKDLSAEQEAHQRFERLFHNNPALMAVSSIPDRRFTDVNAAFLATLGYERKEVVGKTAAELNLFMDREQQDAVGKMVVAEKRVPGLEMRVRCKDGTIRNGLFSGEIIQNQGGDYFLTVMVDVTERIALERRLHQMEKTESLSRMAGSVAHHFNNMLGVVMGNLELARLDLPEPNAIADKLAESHRAARRAAEMSRLMLTLLGQTLSNPRPIDLSETCLDRLEALRAEIPAPVALESDLPLPGPVVIVDSAQVGQVLAGLVSNAWEAIGDGPGNIRLSVSTAKRKDIPEDRRFPVDWQPAMDDYACLTVTDTGRGMSGQTIDRIFDPFYTDKFTGRGLGLAVALGIIKSFRGCITVESRVGGRGAEDGGRRSEDGSQRSEGGGQGTEDGGQGLEGVARVSRCGSVFRVFLPLSTEAVPRRAPEKSVDAQGMATGGVILVVDDQDMVRNVAKSILEKFGFEVLTAEDGVEALEIFRRNPAGVRLVLTDLSMPRMNGWETLAALREIRPDIQVILASGYDEAKVMEGSHAERPEAFLSKPYRMADLKAALNKALGPVLP